jgi:hypothetical protein
MYYSDLRFILNMFVCHVLIKHIKKQIIKIRGVDHAILCQQSSRLEELIMKSNASNKAAIIKISRLDELIMKSN